ncbi:MAG: metallophosphoesterase [Treponemataceae bacterium]
MDPSPELLVISDTHGDLPALVLVFRWAKRRGIGMLAFLGDGLSDVTRACEKTRFKPLVRTVRGNGDTDSSVPFKQTLDFLNVRFLLVHGHSYSVQETLDSLVFNARTAGASVALFGHTHTPFRAIFRGILLVNPGSPSRPRNGAEPSFATIRCDGDGKILADHWRIDGDGSIHEYDLSAKKSPGGVEPPERV